MQTYDLDTQYGVENNAGNGAKGSVAQLPGEVTDLLDAWSRGETEALGELMELVHEELRQLARSAFRRERRNHTLQPTAVVHELYMKLRGQRNVDWRDRAHFFAAAANHIRRILVDHARGHVTLKRGAGALRLSLDDLREVSGRLDPEVVALDDALIDLERRSPRQARIAEMHGFAGMTLEEIALVEGISRTTVARDWKTARLFLHGALAGE